MANQIFDVAILDPLGQVINPEEVIKAGLQAPRRLRAHADVYFNGKNITDQLDPYLISIRISDRQEGASTCSLQVDDRYAKFPNPPDGSQVYVNLGWPGEQSYRAFRGVLTDVRSMGSRRGGRQMHMEFMGSDMSAGLKESVTGTWGGGKDAPTPKDIDFKTVAEEVAKKAGITLKIDPSISGNKRKFWEIANEPPMQWLQRMAREQGGALKIEGSEASIVSLAQDNYTNVTGEGLPAIDALVGRNVLAWDIRPTVARAQWAATARGFFDRDKAKWLSVVEKVAGGFGFGKATARHMAQFPVNDAEMAKTAALSDTGISVRERGTGWVLIDGDPRAQANAPVDVQGARPGVDGRYRATEVELTYYRGGGFLTRCDVNNPVILSAPQVTGSWK